MGLVYFHHMTYLSISRWVPTAEGAGDDNEKLLVLKVGPVIVLHATHLGGKHPIKDILDHMGVIAGTACLCGKEDGGFDSLLVDFPEHFCLDLDHSKIIYNSLALIV